MTRIAIISDAHSNIPATAAVFKHIDNNRIDYIYSIGDMIGKGPSPCEVVDLHKSYCNISILGNWEDFLLYSGIYENPISYYRRLLSDDHLSFFKSLGYVIEFFMSGRFFRIFHAHPDSVYKRVFKKVPLLTHMEMFMPPATYNTDFPGKAADIVIYGDIHYPYHISFDDLYFEAYYKALKDRIFATYDEFAAYNKVPISFLKGRTIYNAGSIGQPFGSTLASYIVLEGALGSEENSDLKIEAVSVKYDLSLASKIALESTMYDRAHYSAEILTGIYRGYSPCSDIIDLL